MASAEGEKISELIIKGNRTVETSVILNTVKLKAGDVLTMETVDGDIRAIYKLGFFQDVKAETGTSDTGIILAYVVTEKPVVREIKLVGNKELSAEKIKEAFDIKPNAIFSVTELNSGIRKVKKLYADQGYYLADVNASTEKRTNADYTITLRIVEGEKVLIKTIAFEGNKAFPARKLKGQMETNEKWFLSFITDAGTYKEEVLKNDIALIAEFYYNNGYVNIKVGEPKVEILPDKSGLVITIGITEGEQFRTGTLDFKGDLLESKEFLAGKLKLKPGEVFSRAFLRNDIATLTDIYADKGYAFTNVNPVTSLDLEKKTINISFDFEKGEKVYIDRINISGNTKTRDKVVRREMRLAEGDLYNATAIKKSKQELMNLGYFEQANLSMAKGSAVNRQNINVEVKEKPTGTFSIGAGYSSLDGIVGQGSVQQSNFFGLGLKANLAASLGGKSQTYNVGITDPYFMDTKWTLGGDVYRTLRDFTDFTRQVTGGDIKGGYPLTDTLSTFWLYRYEDRKISNESPALLNSIALGQVVRPETSSTTSSITGSLTHNTTDYRLDPSSGMVNTFSTEVAGLGGTNKFIRYIGNSKLFVPFKWGSVFSLRGEIGHIQGLGMEVPIDERFYLGGINTIRGYGNRQVSPYKTTMVTYDKTNGAYIAPGQAKPPNYVDVLSRAFVGGQTEAYMNAEYVIPIAKEIGLKGVLFFDAGGCDDGLNKALSRIQTSYGFGLRWYSPMGPLRIEYGIPINPRPDVDKGSGKIEFSMGNVF